MRAIAETEDKLCEMNRLVSEKISQQRRLIDKLRDYVRVRDNLSQRAASSDDSSSSSSSTQVADDEGEMQEQDALSAQLSAVISCLKAMTSESVQVSYYY